MKIAVRVFTMLVVFAGLALASVSSANVKAIASQLFRHFMDPGPLGLPVPQCGPGVPTCTASTAALWAACGKCHSEPLARKCHCSVTLWLLRVQGFSAILRKLSGWRASPEMTSQFAMSAMSVAEFLLWATLAFLFWKRDLIRRFPAMATYVALHLFSTPFLLLALYVQAQPWGRGYYGIYFYPFLGRLSWPAQCCCASSALKFSVLPWPPSRG